MKQSRTGIQVQKQLEKRRERYEELFTRLMFSLVFQGRYIFSLVVQGKMGKYDWFRNLKYDSSARNVHFGRQVYGGDRTAQNTVFLNAFYLLLLDCFKNDLRASSLKLTLGLYFSKAFQFFSFNLYNPPDSQLKKCFVIFRTRWCLILLFAIYTISKKVEYFYICSNFCMKQI